jgi:hypothetical protein
VSTHFDSNTAETGVKSKETIEGIPGPFETTVSGNKKLLWKI